MRRDLGLTHVLKDSEVEAARRPLSLSLFKRIFGYTRNYKHILHLLLVCVVLRAMQVPLLTWSLSAVIKGPVSHGQLRQLVLGVLGYTALSVFTNYTLYHRQRLALLLGEGAVHDMRSDLFAHLQTLTMSFFTGTRLGRLISRFSSDAESVRMGLQNAVFVSIVGTGQMLVAALILLYTDWGLFMVVLATAPLYYFTYMYFRERLSTASREVQESFSRVTSNLAESVTGVRVTQGYARQDTNARLFGELVLDHAEYNMNVARAAGTFNPVVEFMGQFVMGLIFIVGGYHVLHGHASVDTLIVFYFLTGEVLNPLVNVGMQYNTAVTAMAGAERVFALLDRQPDFKDAPDAKPLPPISGRVELEHLDFHYVADRPILRDLNFVAEPGQTIALVGHTGSGKTTIVNLIAKFYLPTGGRVLIDGHDLNHVQSNSLHRQMGIVLQVNFLFTGTVMENIRVGKPGASDEEVLAAIKRLEVQDLLEALPQGLQSTVGERGAGMSLGQRQIICFARAMLADPRILILDEATSSVDALTEHRIQEALAKLLRGRTSFVVAHRLSTIRHADVVLVLDKGQLVERGTHIELLAAGGIYSNLYQDFLRASKA